jgi:hypothetical protein
VLLYATLLQPQALKIYEMKRADDEARERDTEHSVMKSNVCHAGEGSIGKNE